MDEEPIFITIWATGQKIVQLLLEWLTLQQEHLCSRECRNPHPKEKVEIMSIYYPKDWSSGKQVILLIQGREDYSKQACLCKT